MQNLEQLEELNDVYTRLDETLEDDQYSNLDGDQFINAVLQWDIDL